MATIKKSTVKKAVAKKSIKKAQDGVNQVTTKLGATGYDPTTETIDRSKQKTTEKINSQGQQYTSKYKSIGYDLDKDGKATNPTITKIKTDDSGKETKRFTKPVSMGRAKRNVRRMLGSDAPEAMKKGGMVKKKMKNGGSLSGLKASTKRDKGIDPKGAYTTVQKRTLAGAKGKAKLTADKQLGATKMAKRGMNISKKK